MTTTREDRELAIVQLAATDSESRLDAEDAAEQAEDGVFVPLRDEDFKLSDEVAIMALMEWAAAGDDTDSSTANLKAVYHVIESLLVNEKEDKKDGEDEEVPVRDDAEFKRFRAYCRDHKVSIREMIDFQNAAFEALSGNPTGLLGSSGSTPSRTSAGSTASSSGRRARASKR